MLEHRDLTGREVRVGDFIVYAALWDRSATLRFGRVAALKERTGWGREPSPTVRAPCQRRSRPPSSC